MLLDHEVLSPLFMHVDDNTIFFYLYSFEDSCQSVVIGPVWEGLHDFRIKTTLDSLHFVGICKNNDACNTAGDAISGPGNLNAHVSLGSDLRLCSEMGYTGPRLLVPPHNKFKCIKIENEVLYPINFISIWYLPYKGLNCFKIEMSVTLTQFSQLHMYISIICVL